MVTGESVMVLKCLTLVRLIAGLHPSLVLTRRKVPDRKAWTGIKPYTLQHQTFVYIMEMDLKMAGTCDIQAYTSDKWILVRRYHALSREPYGSHKEICRINVVT